MIDTRTLLLIGGALALASAVARPQESPPAQAPERSVVDRYDHIETGFPLEGAHEQVECQQCHRAGVFRGTPRLCSDCHNNVTAEGKGFRHIPTALQCSDCHTVQDWRLARFDHAGFDFGCMRCHNNFTAPGKLPDHPPTSNVCEDCHTTVHWDLRIPRDRRPGGSLGGSIMR